MAFKIGSRGPEVQQIQQALQSFGFNVGPIDGIFGESTKRAVIAFQRLRGLDADGVVGVYTWRALFSQEIPEPEIALPLLQKSLMSILGNPLEPFWPRQNIVFIDLAEFQNDLHQVKQLHTHGNFGFYGHKLIQDNIKQVFRSLQEHDCLSEIKTFDGCFNIRKMRSGNRLSVHSWGLAIDLNALQNPFNSDVCEWSDTFLDIFASYGWESGCLWSSPSDPMHFQFAWTRDWRGSTLDFVPRIPER